MELVAFARCFNSTVQLPAAVLYPVAATEPGEMIMTEFAGMRSTCVSSTSPPGFCNRTFSDFETSSGLTL